MSLSDACLAINNFEVTQKPNPHQTLAHLNVLNLRRLANTLFSVMCT